MSNLERLKNVINSYPMSNYYDSVSNTKLPKKYDISIIIPVMGRLEFLKPLISSITDAIKKTDKEINITIVEHSTEPIFKDPVKNYKLKNIKYHWIEKREIDPFNKSLCHNVGAILNKNSDFLLFHDLDCIVLDSFFDNLFKLIKDGYEFIQTFRDRRLLYLNQELTNHIINQENYYDFNQINHVTVGKCCAPGGSILISKQLFISIGGFDPEFFYGYSPEDQFFWDKAATYTQIQSANNEMYHMFHTSLSTTNSSILNMINYVKDFNTLTQNEKIIFLNYKKITIEKYMTI